jgi:MFS family permease
VTRRLTFALPALLLAAFAINLDTTIVNVALPTLARELHASNSQLQWIVDAYNLVFAAFLLAAGSLSDRLGRKGMVVAGMWIQAAGIFLVALTDGFVPWAGGMVLLGLGTALVYPTLLAAVSDVAHPEWRASAVGVYRLWRDGGYAVGALLAGLLADLLGVSWAIAGIGALTFASGVLVLARMYETLPAKRVPDRWTAVDTRTTVSVASRGVSP